MTLISIEGGGSSRKCTAKCHDAKKKKCCCCCGGMNHGRGKELAIAQTLNYSKDLRERWELEHPGQKMLIKPVQLELFAKELELLDQVKRSRKNA